MIKKTQEESDRKSVVGEIKTPEILILQLFKFTHEVLVKHFLQNRSNGKKQLLRMVMKSAHYIKCE